MEQAASERVFPCYFLLVSFLCTANLQIANMAVNCSHEALNTSYFCMDSIGSKGCLDDTLPACEVTPGKAGSSGNQRGLLKTITESPAEIKQKLFTLAFYYLYVYSV